MSTIYRGPIAGHMYGHFKLRPDRLRGCRLYLEAEPENPVDPNAVMVRADFGEGHVPRTVKVGYIPKEMTGNVRSYLSPELTPPEVILHMPMGERPSWQFHNIEVRVGRSQSGFAGLTVSPPSPEFAARRRRLQEHAQQEQERERVRLRLAQERERVRLSQLEEYERVQRARNRRTAALAQC